MLDSSRIGHAPTFTTDPLSVVREARFGRQSLIERIERARTDSLSAERRDSDGSLFPACPPDLLVPRGSAALLDGAAVALRTGHETDRDRRKSFGLRRNETGAIEASSWRSRQSWLAS